MKNRVLFISATHGDEGFSIEVLNKISRKYSPQKYDYKCIIGNPKALRKGVRFIKVDLNRSAPGNKMSKFYEEKRAAQLMRIANQFNFVIDLHGATSKCGIVLIISNLSVPNFILGGMLPVKKVVVWLDKGPITQACQSPGLEIECGPKQDRQIQKRLRALLIKFLKTYRGLKGKEIVENLKQKEIYLVYGELKDNGKIYQDFIQAKENGERFFPFMSGQYPGIACYKMRKIDLKDLSLLPI